MKKPIFLAATAAAIALTAVVAVTATHQPERGLAVAAGSTSDLPSIPPAETAPAAVEPGIATTSTEVSKDDSTGRILADHEDRIGVLEATTTTTTAVTAVTDAAPTTTTTIAEPATSTSTTSTTIFTRTPPTLAPTTTTTLPAAECALTVSYVGSDQWNGNIASNRPGQWAHLYIGAGPAAESRDILLDSSGRAPFQIRGVSQNQNWYVSISFDGKKTCEKTYTA